MSKVGLIIGREYFTRVKKKSFLITTILVPVIMIGFYVGIVGIMIKGGSDKQRVAILDEASLLNDSTFKENQQAEYSLIKNETETSFVKKYKSQGYDAFLYIPKINIDTPRGIVLHSTSAMSLSGSSSLERMLNRNIEDKRLRAQGIDPTKYKSIAADVDIESTIDTKDGGKKSIAGVATAISYICGILIYMMMIIYGTQVMRGVTEEKTNRIAEVIISSVKPFELMMGKILGIGAVGLTQFAIWIILIFAGQFLLPVVFPDLLNQVNNIPEAGSKASMISGVLQSISSLPLMKIVVSFMFYFLGGYLTYASLFAAVGSVVSEDQQEAQQLIFPILMPIILGFVILTKAITDPNSSLAVFGSIFPLTSPIVMMGRITYDVPFWQMAASVLSLIGCFLFFSWITGKVYRTGILMYGKKPSWKEMAKWAFRRG